MYDDRLFINDKELDLNINTSVSENYQINDLFSLSDRQTSYTDTFEIPKTDNNINILGGLGLVGNASTAPYTINSLTYFRKGVHIFSKASAYISETSDMFKLNCYFGNNSLFEDVSGLKLSELPISQYDHELNQQNWIDRLNGDVLLYALANYGAQTDNVIVYEYQIPAIKTAFIWEKIFQMAGYSFIYAGRGGRNDYNPFLSDKWLNTYITITSGLEQGTTSEAAMVNLTGLNDRAYNIGSLYRIDIDKFLIHIHEYRLPYEYYIFAILSNVQYLVNGNVKYTARSGSPQIDILKSAYYRFEFTGTIIVQACQELAFRITRSGIVISDTELSVGTNDIAIDTRIYLTAGEDISFQFYAINEEPNENLQWASYVNCVVSEDNRTPVVTMSSYFDSIDQKSFLKDMINYYGLIYRRRGTVYEFMSFRELFDINASYANFNIKTPVNYAVEDWSDKFNIVINEEYNLGDYYQRNNFTYKYDNDADTFANGVITINNRTLEDEGSLIDRIYKAPASSGFVINNETLMDMKHYEIEAEKIKKKTSVPYIFYAARRSGSFSYKQTGGDIKTYTGDYALATFENLAWSSQIPSNLFTLNNVLTRMRLLTCEIKLTEIDIQNLDFFKLKYIKQLGGIFYLNKISNFTNNTVTKCELIQVTQSSAGGQFSDDFSNDFNN